MTSIRVIDTHTGGEPTRVVIEGGPVLEGKTLAEKRESFRRDFDHYRRAIVCEPRGSDVMVGALLLDGPAVIFFNNVGYLGMCGHGTIGVVEAMRYLGWAEPGPIAVETPVGSVTAVLEPDGLVSVENVLSRVHRKAVAVPVEGYGIVTGDVAWGGNWFFLSEAGNIALNIANAAELTKFTSAIKVSLHQQGITGDGGAEIDHVEIFGPPQGQADSRNFVLCPGQAYDRSPCGTGTSAKLASLAVTGELAPGAVWRQESIVGSIFEGRYRLEDAGVIPTISGRAWVNADSTLLFDDTDPFAWGIPA